MTHPTLGLDASSVNTDTLGDPTPSDALVCFGFTGAEASAI
ncbi:MAG TPA: hypothetical protein VIJ16_00020 [Gemmatimonadaceae bacterium]